MLARRAVAAAARCASVPHAAHRAAAQPARQLPQSWGPPLKRGCAAAAAAAAAPQPPRAGLAHWAGVYAQLSKFRLRRAPAARASSRLTAPAPEIAAASRLAALTPRGFGAQPCSGFVVSTACAGYALGSPDDLQWSGMAWTAAGTWGAAACANALNQVRKHTQTQLHKLAAARRGSRPRSPDGRSLKYATTRS